MSRPPLWRVILLERRCIRQGGESMDQHWDNLVKQFCSISDRLGMPIDDEIFDTVVALNALGITTTMSCAGHITRDEGDIRYPWIDFSASDTEIEDLKKEQAADFYLSEPREVQLQKLAEYRDEMRAFTEFLKTIYLSQHAADEFHTGAGESCT